jgi:putative sulfotransferase
MNSDFADFRSTPTFVVGTGRCGSTMLSDMLREHSKVLSLSEFFVLVTDFWSRMDDTFASEPISGSQFWKIVAAVGPFMAFSFRHELECSEQLYPIGSATTRFSSQTGVPAILVTTLPHLTDDHEALFDVLRNEVAEWSKAPIAKHYRHLFGRLTAYFGKRQWVERSGGGLGVSGQLLAVFPESRIIHVVRDGRDTAVSMREHLVMRLGIALESLTQCLGANPMTSEDRENIDRVPAELRCFLPEQFDADALRAYRFPLSLYGRYWAQQNVSGLEALSALPADRLLTLRYEDILSDTKRQLDILAAFLGEDFVDENWSTRCAATVRKPRSTWRDLPDEEVCALTEACRPGFELLREAGVEYEF